MKPLIYVADDEKNIRELLEKFFIDAGFIVEIFETGDQLFERFLSYPPDFVILDVMMPGTDGFTISQRIREKSEVPIILLTARDTDADFMTGFTTGADDYFTKPFSPVKLVLRIKAMLKRLDYAKATDEELTTLTLGGLTLQSRRRKILYQDREINFTNTEFEVLSYLMRFHDRAVSREELLASIWGYASNVETRVTDDTIKRLRKKLRNCGCRTIIETVWGYGFRMAVLDE